MRLFGGRHYWHWELRLGITRPPPRPTLKSGPFLSRLLSATSATQIPWPTFYGVLQTASVNAAFDCFGGIGISPPAYPPTYPLWPKQSFESPPSSGHHYLWAGAIWIGGIVGADTIVSVGFTNVDIRQEMFPTGFSDSNRVGTVTPLNFPFSSSQRAEFDDTVHYGLTYPPDRFAGPYHPLKVALVNRAHSFRGSGADQCIVYDVIATNVGAQVISKGYFGVYLDADVYSETGNLGGYNDDLAGSMRNRGLAYIVDNDGDPQGGTYTAQRSPTKIMALKFLNCSFQPTDTNFNWWVRDNAGYQDFGPRQKSYPRDFGSGGSGSPIGDGNEYYVMSTPEWDYDQVMTASIFPDDPRWVYPDPAIAYPIHRGADTRFLLSVGPFNLLPDSSIRVQFALFTADSVHTDPFILDFVDIAPELYPLALNLPAAEKNAAIADSLGDLLADPALPPTGVHVVDLSADSATIAWDPWLFPGVDSIDLYLSPIPDTSFRDGQSIPIWYRPTELLLSARLGGDSRRTVVHGLTPGAAYACTIANRAGSASGSPSLPALFRMPDSRQTVRPDDSVLLVLDGARPVVRWRDSIAGLADHFNIYRFADTAQARVRYRPYYSFQRLDIDPSDSVLIDTTMYYYYALQPYAQVPGDILEFEDAAWSDGNVYVIAPVDSEGVEYPFSSPVIAYRIPPRTKDILVLTNSGGRINFVFGSTLRDFYASLLTGYQKSIYSYIDTVSAGCGLYMDECLDWRDFMAYRMLIIDDGMKDALYSGRFEQRTHGFQRYLATGGTILYCGSFSSVDAYRFDLLTPPNWYDLPSPAVTDNFGVDSVYYAGAYYFKAHATPPYVDTLFGFVRAEPAISGAPELLYDQTGSAFTLDLTTYWPEGTAPSVSTFRLDQRGEITHRYRSASPATSVNEGQAVGVMTNVGGGQSYLFGFHLWYLQPDGARRLVDWIMDRIPTGMPNDSGRSLPSTITLAQNYPNPFNPTTTISFNLPTRSKVRLELFNILGQQVRLLTDETLPAGRHDISFDGRNSNGQLLSSGIYLYRLVSDQVRLTRKMIMLK